MERTTPWNGAPDINLSTRKLGKGRPRQHDVGVTKGGVLTLACETKWLKTSDSDSILEDLWKLALTHGTSRNERDCCRTFLLVGGIKKP